MTSVFLCAHALEDRALFELNPFSAIVARTRRTDWPESEQIMLQTRASIRDTRPPQCSIHWLPLVFK